ncbi:MAG: hypothetical protein KGL39_34940 [Patescibacteria group bacterium]|nr:hypothetical protein [Patescibacteria group bacterium]
MAANKRDFPFPHVVLSMKRRYRSLPTAMQASRNAWRLIAFLLILADIIRACASCAGHHLDVPQ